MLNPISNNIENVWESWSIRVVIVFSLSLQIFLTISSPLRKQMNNIYIKIFIWLAYLMADSAAIFCVGHIASSQVSSNKIKINPQNHLLSFWASFLLVHLGGPDTITAFSLEDNQLWRRHMLGFITQLIFCAYVFLLTVPGNRLWIPTVLVFVVGIIKYGERIYAMYLATSPHEKSPHATPLISERIVDFTRKIITKFQMGSPRDTLRMTEVMMNLNYDMFFNKFLLPYGYLCRFVTITFLLISLGLFLFEEKQYKQGFDPFDITITYTLICSALALDIIALFMQFFSDRVIVFFPKLGDFSFMKSIQELKRTRWSNCKKKPYTKFTQLSTFLPFRRWSESISGFNMISYSRYMIRKQSSLLHYFNILSGGTIFMWLNEVKNPFLLELWDFIFHEIKHYEVIMYYENPRGNESGLRIFRESLISEDINKKLIPYMWNWSSTGIGKFVIVWHIATHLCYYVQMSDDDVEFDKREFSKLLSDYIMYIWVLQPDMIPEANSSDIKRILDDLQVNLKPCFTNDDEDEVGPCKSFMDEQARREVPDFPLSNSNLCIHAVMLAKELGKISDPTIKWEIIIRVWVQFLGHVVHECNFSIHAQHLCKGGELISFLHMCQHLSKGEELIFHPCPTSLKNENF